MNEILQEQAVILEQLNEDYDRGNFDFQKPWFRLNPFGNTDLSGWMRFKTSNMSKLTVKINGFSYSEKEFVNEHSIAIFGLEAGKENKVELSLFDGKSYSINKYCIKTADLDEEYPRFIKNKIQDLPEFSELYLLSLGRSESVKTIKPLFSMIDGQGEVRWIYNKMAAHVFKKLVNGNILLDSPISAGSGGAYAANGLIEITLYGLIVNYYPLPNGLHHDAIELPNGNFIVITQGVETKQDVIVELDRQTHQIVKQYDFNHILQRDRITVIDKIAVNHPLDWLHLNGVVYDERDDSLIVSSRNQSCVVKITRQGEIKWILAPHEGWNSDFEKYLLKPIDDNFEWNFAQHSPDLNLNDDLLIFNNGNYRSYNLADATLAYQNHSNGVILHIDEEKMTVEEIWQFGRELGNQAYCTYLGGAQSLGDEHALLCFGGITKDLFGNPIDDMKNPRMKNRVRLIEIDKENIIFDIEMIDDDYTKALGYKCYRATKLSF